METKINIVLPSYEILNMPDPIDIIRHIEFCGRTCYKSESRITSESASQFMEMLVKRGHLSVIEHISFSVKFVCDRGVSHELVRHRLCSFSQESTRYCNYKDKMTFVKPSWVSLDVVGTWPMDGKATANLGDFFEMRKGLGQGERIWLDTLVYATNSYMNLLKEGWQPEKARSVLPNSLKTEIVVSANLREWCHIFKLRTSLAAHPQMQELMTPLRNEVLEALPELAKLIE